MSNLSDALRVEHPDDVAKLRAQIPILYRFSDIEIEKLWDDFSDSYAAGWLFVQEETIESFKAWLES